MLTVPDLFAFLYFIDFVSPQMRHTLPFSPNMAKIAPKMCPCIAPPSMTANRLRVMDSIAGQARPKSVPP
jgi:hypothetical protein